MPLSYAQLTAKTAQSTLHLEEGDLEVEWYPARLSAQIVSQIAAIERVKSLPSEQALDALRSAAAIILELVARWDLVEEDGGPLVPLTPERLARFGLPVLWGIILALMKETQLDPPRGVTKSGASSTPISPARMPRRPVSPRRRPTGTSKSTSRRGSA